MRFGKRRAALAVAFGLAVPALAPANAAPISANPIATVEVSADIDAPIHKVGHRHSKFRKSTGGISYVSRYGLKYAPGYRHRRPHGHGISVKVYIRPHESDGYRRHTRPLIVDLPN